MAETTPSKSSAANGAKTPSHPIHRPFTISLLYIWAIISGIANIMAGIFLIIQRNDPELKLQTLHNSSQLVAAGIVAIIFGSIMIMLGSALAQGSNFVRILFAVFASLNVAFGFWEAIAFNSVQQFAGSFSLVFGLLALYLLFNRHAEEFFEDRNPV